MKIAITGASGYIGGLLAAAHAARGDTVHALTRGAARKVEGVRWFEADLLNAERIPREFFEGAHVLYHCAAELACEELMHALNVEATRALAARASGSIGRWVQLSTAGVYGNQRMGTITEDSPIRPGTRYAATKSEADRLIQDCDTPFSIVRPVAIIGAHMINRSIHAWLSAIDRGVFFFIAKPGAVVNYVHEKNVVSALTACAVSPAAHNRIYNISQDAPIELFVSALAAAIARPPPRLRVPEPLARAAAALGSFIPAFPLTSARIDALTRRARYPTDRIERELGYRISATLDSAATDIAGVWKNEAAR